jgi:hypothetical protein
MSDFEISDSEYQNDDDAYIDYQISDNEYQEEYGDYGNSGDNGNSGNDAFEINMDSESIPDTKINNEKSKSKIKIEKKPIPIPKPKSTFNDILNIENTIEEILDKPITIKKKSINVKQTKDLQKISIDTPETPAQAKLTKIEENFEINKETIEYFSKGLEPIKVFTKRSPYSDNTKDTKFANNDTKIICLLLKCQLIEDYKCNTPKCKVKHIWNGVPIQLLLNRKNGIHNDLSVSNLEFLCANCYMTTYGLEMFKKKAKETVLNCDNCGFPLVKFSNGRKKSGVCLACEKKMNNLSYEKVQSSYYNQLQEVYSDNPLLSDDIHRPRHFKDVSKYKKKIASSYKPRKDGSNNGNDGNGNDGCDGNDKNKPIIQLNMSMPDISDLMKDI